MSVPWGEVFGVVRKESGPAALGIAAMAGVYLFLPAVAAIGPAEWRPYGLLVFLIASSVAVARGIDATLARVKARAKVRNERRRLFRLIRHLPPEAKGLVRLLMNEEALRLDARDATVSLVQAMDLTHRSSVSYEGFWFDFTLQPDARWLLSENLDLLDGAQDPTVVVAPRHGEDD